MKQHFGILVVPRRCTDRSNTSIKGTARNVP